MGRTAKATQNKTVLVWLSSNNLYIGNISTLNIYISCKRNKKYKITLLTGTFICEVYVSRYGIIDNINNEYRNS